LTIFCCFELHVNLWYAEYTDEEVIRRFPNLYRSVLEVFKKNPQSRCAFDFDESRTIPFLERIAPDVIEQLKAGVMRGQFEVLLDTWSLTLPPFLTQEEFLYQHKLAEKELHRVFGEKGVSKGYLCQENSYSPTVIPLLRKVGVQFLCTPFTSLSSSHEKVNLDKDRFVLIEGHENVEIPTVVIAYTGSWDTTLHEIMQLSRRVPPSEDIIFFALFDAEMVQPEKLDEVIKGIINQKGLAFTLPSEFIRSHKPTKRLSTTWESTTVGDFGLWVRDPADHYLLTLNEQARHAINSAKFWIDKAEEVDVDVSEEKRELSEALLYQLQGLNSDKMGWNPCWDKRKLSEAEFISAMEKANIARAMASEKLFAKSYPLVFPEKSVKSYLLCNHTQLDAPKIPLRIPLREPRILISPNNVTMLSEGNELPFELVEAKTKKQYSDREKQEELLEATLICCEEVKARSWKQLHAAAKPYSGKMSRQSFEVSPSILSNGALELKLTNGLPVELTHKNLGVTYTSAIGAPILRTEASLRKASLRDSESIVSSTVTNSGERGVYAELTTRTSQAYISLATRYRVYAGLPFLEVEKTLDVALEDIGVVKPLILDLGFSRPKLYHRELNSIIAPRKVMKDDLDRYILVNDWFSVSDDQQNGVAVASESTISAFKEIVDRKNGPIELANYQTYNAESKAERFRGTYIHRFYIVPTAGKSETAKVSATKDGLEHLLQALARPPHIVTMTQREGPRIK
jgi:hypothetical protein